MGVYRYDIISHCYEFRLGTQDCRWQQQADLFQTKVVSQPTALQCHKHSSAYTATTLSSAHSHCSKL